MRHANPAPDAPHANLAALDELIEKIRSMLGKGRSQICPVGARADRPRGASAARLAAKLDAEAVPARSGGPWRDAVVGEY